jgi:hypothetical protein
MNCRAAFEGSTFPEASCMKTSSCWDAGFRLMNSPR